MRSSNRAGATLLLRGSAAINVRQPPPTKSAGTRIGVLLASAATIVAIFGQLTTLFYLVKFSTAGPTTSAFLYAGLGVLALAAFIYVSRSIRLIIPDPPERPEDRSSLLPHRGLVAAAL
ncbi:MAG: hypothetical protein JOY58_15495 [Solirubrobacterales bacterium]|nr:hypothetical protein [Solirubrobacterales bacterium]